MEIQRNVTIQKLSPVTEAPEKVVEKALVKAVINGVVRGTNTRGEIYHKFLGIFQWTVFETGEIVVSNSAYFPSIITDTLVSMYLQAGAEETEKKRFAPTGEVVAVTVEFSGPTVETAFKLKVKPNPKAVLKYEWSGDFLTQNAHNPFASLDAQIKQIGN